jgi:hypothetical protein
MTAVVGVPPDVLSHFVITHYFFLPQGLAALSSFSRFWDCN